MAEVKKHKSHAGLIVFIVILVIIGLPIALLYGFCYDATKHDPNIQPAEASQVVQDAVFDSFAPAKAEKKLKLSVGQEQLNSVFKGIYNKLNPEVQKYVKGIYVDINNEKYTFYVEAEVPMFSSRAIVETTFTETINETNPLQGYFTFKIVDAKVARLSGALDWVDRFAPNALTDFGKTLQNAFQNAGLSIKVDMKQRTFTYVKADLVKDAMKMIGEQKLVGDLIDVFFEKGLTKLNPNGGTAMTFETNLVPLHTNANYVVEADSLNLDLAPYKTKTLDLIKKGIVPVTSKDLGAIQQYLIRGYEGSSETERNAVKNLNLTSIGISDYTTYKGADLESGKVDIEQSMKEQAIANIPTFATNHIIGSISESDINSMLHASSLIGTSTIFTKGSGETADLVYVTFNDVTAQLVNDHVYLSLAASLNGYDIRFIIVTTLDASAEQLAQYKVALRFDSFYFGEYKAPQNIENTILDYMGKGFASTGEIAFLNNSLILDFSGSIDTITDAAIKLVGNPKAEVIGNGLGDANAKLQLSIQPHI